MSALCQKRTLELGRVMSALCQKRTSIIFRAPWHVGLSKSHVYHQLALGRMPGNIPLPSRILRQHNAIWRKPSDRAQAIAAADYAKAHGKAGVMKSTGGPNWKFPGHHLA